MDVMLDNSAVNGLIEKDSFQFTQFYQNLKILKDRGQIRVIATPTNVIELSLFPKEQFQLRNNLSIALNNLIDGKNLVSDFEYNSLYNFSNLVNRHFNGGINDITVVNYLAGESIFPYLAILAEMAAIPEFDIPESLRSIQYSKLITTATQLLFITEPEVYLKAIIQQSKNEVVDPAVSKTLNAFDDTSIEELKTFIVDKKKNVSRIKNLTTYQKVKKDIVEDYTGALLYETLCSCFRYYENFVKLFNIEHIVNNWNMRFENNLDKYVPLDKNIIDAISNKTTLLKPYYFSVIFFLCQRYSNGLIPDFYFSINNFFEELEQNFRDPKEISEGLNLDLNYLSNLNRVDYFITFDKAQGRSANKYIGNMKSLNGEVSKRILNTAKELEELI
jgi:hypothetical protein